LVRTNRLSESPRSSCRCGQYSSGCAGDLRPLFFASATTPMIVSQSCPARPMMRLPIGSSSAKYRRTNTSLTIQTLIARMVKKLVESIMPSTVFDGDGIPAWGGCYSPRVSAIARKYNPRPEQKLAHHTENTKHEDQLPSARFQPQPHCLPWSLDSSQQVIGENKETQHRRQLVTVRSVVLADRDFFSSCAMVGEKEPNKPDRYV